MVFQLWRIFVQIQLVLAFTLIPFLGIASSANAQPVESNPVTTVMLVRHADRGNGDFLTSEGINRAKDLVQVLEKANITAIFRTNTQRNQQTVNPLAEFLNLIPIIYNDNKELVTQILTQHSGKFVLVAGHSDTIGPIIESFGGNPDNCRLTGNEFDNLCVISINGSNQVNVINLQYGKPSP
jgi:broad specificity phosphatase PhoE